MGGKQLLLLTFLLKFKYNITYLHSYFIHIECDRTGEDLRSVLQHLNIINTILIITTKLPDLNRLHTRYAYSLQLAYWFCNCVNVLWLECAVPQIPNIKFTTQRKKAFTWNTFASLAQVGPRRNWCSYQAYTVVYSATII